MSWWSYKPYQSVAQRRADAAAEVARMRAAGEAADPVLIDGKAIATTFWGKAWCKNLDAYSDMANRLPRGRSYARNGAVCDLKIEPGLVSARVCGSEMYDVRIKIDPLSPEDWAAVKRSCAGQIGSLVDLLRGKLSDQVMAVVTARPGGLFPRADEVQKSCSCPDWADLCKHAAAAMYGVGNRLDREPELLFALRGVDHLELIAAAGEATASAGVPTSGKSNRIAAGELGDVFGIEMAGDGIPEVPALPKSKKASKPAKASKSGRGEKAKPIKKVRQGKSKAASAKSASKPKSSVARSQKSGTARKAK